MSRARGVPRLALSVHDVAPQTWDACTRILRAVESVAPVPVTLLVVPNYHGTGLRRVDAAYRRALEARLARGDELALHGWTHLDSRPLHGGILDTLRRTRLTAREGEFAALSKEQARALLQAGVDWFAKHGWPLHGFVAPAWLMSRDAWHAVADLPFAYATTRERLYLLPERVPCRTHTFVYSTRGRLRRNLSLVRNEALRWVSSAAPTVRLALHPADAQDTAVMRQWQRLLRELLRERTALTKWQLARALRAATAAPTTARARSAR